MIIYLYVCVCEWLVSCHVFRLMTPEINNQHKTSRHGPKMNRFNTRLACRCYAKKNIQWNSTVTTSRRKPMVLIPSNSGLYPILPTTSDNHLDHFDPDSGKHVFSRIGFLNIRKSFHDALIWLSKFRRFNWHLQIQGMFWAFLHFYTD